MNLETESFYLAPGIMYSNHIGQEQLELSLLITLATIFFAKADNLADFNQHPSRSFEI